MGSMMKASKATQFLSKFILYSLIALACGLVCSYPLWFPSLCYSMKQFLFTSLPNIWSFFINAKSLFIVGNFIVIFLVGESKLGYSSQQARVLEVYDEEFVERSRIRTVAAVSNDLGGMKEEREVEKKVEESVSFVEEDNEKKDDDEEEKEDDEEREENGDEREGDGDGEEEAGLPAEELNKRVEDFIAKVNKQRCLEAQFFLLSTNSS